MTLTHNKLALNRTTPHLMLSSVQERQQICVKARMSKRRFDYSTSAKAG